jgi:hypothetical protein
MKPRYTVLDFAEILTNLNKCRLREKWGCSASGRRNQSYLWDCSVFHGFISFYAIYKSYSGSKKKRNKRRDRAHGLLSNLGRQIDIMERISDGYARLHPTILQTYTGIKTFLSRLKVTQTLSYRQTVAESWTKIPTEEDDQTGQNTYERQRLINSCSQTSCLGECGWWFRRGWKCRLDYRQCITSPFILFRSLWTFLTNWALNWR